MIKKLIHQTKCLFSFVSKNANKLGAIVALAFFHAGFVILEVFVLQQMMEYTLVKSLDPIAKAALLLVIVRISKGLLHTAVRIPIEEKASSVFLKGLYQIPLQNFHNNNEMRFIDILSEDIPQIAQGVAYGTSCSNKGQNSNQWSGFNNIAAGNLGRKQNRRMCSESIRFFGFT